MVVIPPVLGQQETRGNYFRLRDQDQNVGLLSIL